MFYFIRLYLLMHSCITFQLANSGANFFFFILISTKHLHESVPETLQMRCSTSEIDDLVLTSHLSHLSNDHLTLAFDFKHTQTSSPLQLWHSSRLSMEDLNIIV